MRSLHIYCNMLATLLIGKTSFEFLCILHLIKNALAFSLVMHV